MAPKRNPTKPSWLKKVSNFVKSCSCKTTRSGSSAEEYPDFEPEEQDNYIAPSPNMICSYGMDQRREIYTEFVSSFQKTDYDFDHRMEAYLNVMTFAKEAGFWNEDIPESNVTADVVNVFRTPPPPGKKIELSVATAVVPGIGLGDMISIIHDVRRKWSTLLFPVVTKREEFGVPVDPEWNRPRGARFCPGIEVHAAMQLPTTLVSTRYFEFLRFSQRIENGLYAIVDYTSRHYASSFVTSNCIRKPSGVIIRVNPGEPEGCKIIWVEHVEVDETREDNIYSEIINSKSAFGAQRWISLLLQNLKRDKSKFTFDRLTVAPTADSVLFALTNAMKRFFMECVSQHPRHNVATIKSSAEDPIRILHNKTTTEYLTFVGVTSFRVHAKPLSVFEFLMEKDIQLEYHMFADSGNKTDKVNEDPEQTDEVHGEPEQTDEVHEKHEQTDEVHEETEQTHEIQEVHEVPEQTDEVHEKPEQTDEVHEEHEQTDEVHEETEQTHEIQEVYREPEQTDEVHEEHEHTDEVHEETEQTHAIQGVHEEPEQTHEIQEVHEEPEQTHEIQEVHEEPEQSDKQTHEIQEVHEEPDQSDKRTHEIQEVHEEPEQSDKRTHEIQEVHEEPEQSDKRTHEIQEVHEEPEQSDKRTHEFQEVHEEPEQSDKQTHDKPKLVLTFGTDDKSNIISLHTGKLTKLENREYILQEASMDAYCSFILSKTLDEDTVDGSIIHGSKTIYQMNEMRVDNMTPIGFAIMPDSPGELECNACLVTVLMQIYYDPSLTDVNVESVRNKFEFKLNDIIEGLNEKVVGEGKKTELFKTSSEPGNH